MRAPTSVVIRFVLFLSILLCAFCTVGIAQESQNSGSAVSLGDVARQQRTAPRPKAKRVITDDDVPTSPALKPTDENVKKTASASSGDKKQKDSAEESEKAKAKLFIDALAEQKKRVADSQKKLQDLDSEIRRRTALQNSDGALLAQGGTRGWGQDWKAIQDEMTETKKQIEDANAKAEEIREAARKSGVRLPD